MPLVNRSRTILIAVLFCFSLAALPPVRAQDANDLDNYKWRVDGDWWYSYPSGYFGENQTNNYFNINRDFGFGSYSTFTGKLDWHFAHKHHFLPQSSYRSKPVCACPRLLAVGAGVLLLRVYRSSSVYHDEKTGQPRARLLCSEG